MKTIGLLGGMSWESTQVYYRCVNEGIQRRLGGLHSARVALVSVDFHDVETLQRAGDWDRAGRLLAHAARQVEAAGADLLVLCTNTMHRVAEAIDSAIDIPLVHIADATARRIQSEGLRRIGLLGTRFTMEQEFYRGRLAQRHGLDVRVPDEADRQLVHQVIYDELCRGRVLDASRQAYLEIIERMRRDGVEGIIAGCTEIGLLVQPDDVDLPLFDTTRIHADAAVELALGGPAEATDSGA